MKQVYHSLLSPGMPRWFCRKGLGAKPLPLYINMELGVSQTELSLQPLPPKKSQLENEHMSQTWTIRGEIWNLTCVNQVCGKHRWSDHCWDHVTDRATSRSQGNTCVSNHISPGITLIVNVTVFLAE